jgi:hypothetical protein
MVSSCNKNTASGKGAKSSCRLERFKSMLHSPTIDQYKGELMQKSNEIIANVCWNSKEKITNCSRKNNGFAVFLFLF